MLFASGIKTENWQVERPYPGQVGPFAHSDKLWVGYDDIAAVQVRAYVTN